MILIDFTQIAIGSLMVAINRSGENADLILVRHLILNGLRSVSYTHLTLPTTPYV